MPEGSAAIPTFCRAAFRLLLVSFVVSPKVQRRRSGLPSLGSRSTRHNRTGLNHQPQNSKAREGQPSAGSNPAATADLKLRLRYSPWTEPACQDLAPWMKQSLSGR